MEQPVLPPDKPRSQTSPLLFFIIIGIIVAGIVASSFFVPGISPKQTGELKEFARLRMLFVVPHVQLAKCFKD
jgi:hypothetical protein